MKTHASFSWSTKIASVGSIFKQMLLTTKSDKNYHGLVGDKLHSDEFMKVELLTILGKQFSKKEPIVEIFLKVADAPRKLDLVVEPVQ